MIIYNVTVNIHESVHQQWLLWMKNKHIPEVLATGKFSKAIFSRVMIDEEMGGTTYSTQYTTDSQATLEKYYTDDAPQLREEGLRIFGDKMLAFRTMLEVVETF